MIRAVHPYICRWTGVWFILGLVLLVLLTACNLSLSPGAVLEAATDTSVPDTSEPGPSEPGPSGLDTPVPDVPTAVPLDQAGGIPEPAVTETSTPAPTDTPELTATLTPTPSIIPTYAILRGKVIVQQANCRYGPGAPYLYKYGVYQDSVLEIFGRNERGTWVLIRAVGGTNPCWVKASLLEIRGDVMSVEPTYIPLPWSPYYGPLTGVSAVRQGDDVIVSWHPLVLREGDDSEQVPYVVEAWVCQAGELVFIPVGSYSTLVTIVDEAGCTEPSHARVTAAEKHGYTAFVEVYWPPHE